MARTPRVDPMLDRSHTGQLVSGLHRPADGTAYDGEELAGQNLPDFAGDPEDKKEPDRLPWTTALPLFTSGDIDGFVYVCSNNLATALSGAAMLQPLLGDEIVFERIMPGVGLSIVFGCLYYMLQAMFTAGRRGRRDMTAQPFGINTPGMFAWNSGIIISIYFAELGGGADKTEAAETAWSIAVVANFLAGIINVSFCLVGVFINRAVPMVALVGSLASVGIAYLFAGVVQGQAAYPIVTFVSFFLLIMALYAEVAIPKLPKTAVPVGLAAILAWATGLTGVPAVNEGLKLVGFHPPLPSFSTFSYMGKAMSYIGLILPITLSVSVGSIQVRQLAENAGDNYNLTFTMAGDGVATILASCFGCPWGMTVFIGHPAIKSMGAKIGYQWMTALAFGIITWAGLPKVILALIPPQCMNCVVLFVGLAVCGDAISASEQRHFPAFFVSLVPAMLCWCGQQAQAFGNGICKYQREHSNGTSTCLLDAYSPDAFAQTPSMRGLHFMGAGYLLTSIYWAAIMVYIIDRNFKRAMIWALVSTVSASVGMIHSDTVFLPWKGPPAEAGETLPYFLQFTLAYATMAGVFGLVSVAQWKGAVPKGPITHDEAKDIADTHQHFDDEEEDGEGSEEED